MAKTSKLTFSDGFLSHGRGTKVIFDKYLIRLKSLILMNASHNYTSTLSLIL